MLTSVTKTVQVQCPVQKAYSFLADPSNMTQWAIHNLNSISQAGGNVWNIETPRGPGKFVPHFEQAHGILDHEFLDPQEGSWQVPARIVAISPGTSLYMITLTKPEPMAAEAFTKGMAMMASREIEASLDGSVERVCRWISTIVTYRFADVAPMLPLCFSA